MPRSTINISVTLEPQLLAKAKKLAAYHGFKHSFSGYLRKLCIDDLLANDMIKSRSEFSNEESAYSLNDANSSKTDLDKIAGAVVEDALNRNLNPSSLQPSTSKQTSRASRRAASSRRHPSPKSDPSPSN